MAWSSQSDGTSVIITIFSSDFWVRGFTGATTVDNCSVGICWAAWGARSNLRRSVVYQLIEDQIVTFPTPDFPNRKAWTTFLRKIWYFSQSSFFSLVTIYSNDGSSEYPRVTIIASVSSGAIWSMRIHSLNHPERVISLFSFEKQFIGQPGCILDIKQFHYHHYSRFSAANDTHNGLFPNTGAKTRDNPSCVSTPDFSRS